MPAKWFGPTWDAPVCDESPHVDVPRGYACHGCGDYILRDQRGFFDTVWTNGHAVPETPFHYGCYLRFLRRRKQP